MRRVDAMASSRVAPQDEKTILSQQNVRDCCDRIFVYLSGGMTAWNDGESTFLTAESKELQQERKENEK
ncbi:MAG: hypothetical protein IKX74_07945 [Erysipelotrichaceae bacterium]|nr:hypothetical protein [Erysipelotrichaceae bacterium]